MNIFITKDGTRYECSFAQAPKLSPGYHWRDVSPLGAGYGEWIETVAVPDQSGKLFGYDQHEFIKKQYK